MEETRPPKVVQTPQSPGAGSGHHLRFMTRDTETQWERDSAKVVKEGASPSPCGMQGATTGASDLLCTSVPESVEWDSERQKARRALITCGQSRGTQRVLHKDLCGGHGKGLDSMPSLVRSLVTGRQSIPGSPWDVVGGLL